jgi:hypothetical protein
MRVGCNVVPPDREERSREWAAVSSDREIRSRYRLQSGLWSRQTKRSATDIGYRVGCGLVSQRNTQQISAAVSPERVERSR